MASKLTARIFARRSISSASDSAVEGLAGVGSGLLGWEAAASAAIRSVSARSAARCCDHAVNVAVSWAVSAQSSVRAEVRRRTIVGVAIDHGSNAFESLGLSHRRVLHQLPRHRLLVCRASAGRRRRRAIRGSAAARRRTIVAESQALQLFMEVHSEDCAVQNRPKSGGEAAAPCRRGRPLSASHVSRLAPSCRVDRSRSSPRRNLSSDCIAATLTAVGDARHASISSSQPLLASAVRGRGREPAKHRSDLSPRC